MVSCLYCLYNLTDVGDSRSQTQLKFSSIWLKSVNSEVLPSFCLGLVFPPKPCMSSRFRFVDPSWEKGLSIAQVLFLKFLLFSDKAQRG